MLNSILELRLRCRESRGARARSYIAKATHSASQLNRGDNSKANLVLQQ